jgi:bacteriorhodopsin
MQFSLIPDKPLTTTGVGALAMQGSGPDLQTIHWARTTARTFVVRAVGSFLTATAMLSVLAFFAAVPGGDSSKIFLTALSVVINAVAAVHYSWLAKIRNFEGSRWKLLNDAGKTFSPLAAWDTKDAIGVELMIDAIRHSDWAITMPFLVFKLYALINNSTDSPIFESVEAAAAVSVVMILLGAFARLGTDDMSPEHLPTIRYLGFGAYAVSMLCLVLLLIDLGVTGGKVSEGYLLRSFFFIWIGYPVVAFVGVAYRLWFPKHGVTETLSLFKDAGFGLLDCYSKGVFALWTCWTVFGQSLFAAPAAVPFVAS